LSRPALATHIKSKHIDSHRAGAEFDIENKRGRPKSGVNNFLILNYLLDIH